jgi:hypothetical protein
LESRSDASKIGLDVSVTCLTMSICPGTSLSLAAKPWLAKRCMLGNMILNILICSQYWKPPR